MLSNANSSTGKTCWDVFSLFIKGEDALGSLLHSPKDSVIAFVPFLWLLVNQLEP